MVKRYKVSNRLLIVGKDAPAALDLRNVEIVLATDFDALAAETTAYVDKQVARIRELEAEVKRLRYLVTGSPCTCTSHGCISIPPQPTDYNTRHWCARCRELGYDKAGSPSRPDNLSIGTAPSDGGKP